MTQLNNDSSLYVYAYDWVLDDTDTDKCDIRIYGLDERNASVCIRVENFTPYVYVELADEQEGSVVADALRELIHSSTVIFKEHLYNESRGVRPFLFAQFRSCAQRNNFVFRLKQPVKGKIYATHEKAATPILQLISLRQLNSAGWIKVVGGGGGQHGHSNESRSLRATVCDRELVVKWRQLCPPSADEKAALDTVRIQPKIMAFDFEVYSTVKTSMPADRVGDVIFQISCVFNTSRGSILLSLPATDLVERRAVERRAVERLSADGDEYEVLLFETEEDLLVAFINLLKVEKPNVLTGYNILGFDIAYLLKRCARLYLSETVRTVGFNPATPAQEKSIKWSSSAFRNQEFHFIEWEGVLILDLLYIIQRDYKLDNYKLETVAQQFLSRGKDPLTPHDIFKGFEMGRLNDIGKYCVRDSLLCMELLDTLHCWIGLSEMAKVCNVSIFTLYTQGQQVKIYSQVYKYCLWKNIVVDDNGYEATSSERYIGAHVFEPVPGYYENVVPLDFSSLYPSIIIAYNICYSTFADRTYADDKCNVFEWEDHVGCAHDLNVVESNRLMDQIREIDTDIAKLVARRDATKGNVKGRKALQAEINNLRQSQRPIREAKNALIKTKQDAASIMCAKRKYRFLKPEVKKGVIPTIIENLLSARKRVRSRLVECTDASMRVVLDKEQLAYKVSANSMYGAMGVKRGYLPFMPAAMCITYVGRRSIDRTAELITSRWAGKLVYGDTDSNYVIFPHLENNVPQLWSYATAVAESISADFPKPMRLEFENSIYSRFLILSKKRYVYQEVNERGVLSDKIGKKGVVLARRDNSGLIRELYERVVMLIFDKHPYEEIFHYILSFVDAMFTRRKEAKLYVITKSVGDIETYEDGKLGDYKVKALPSDTDKRNRVLEGQSERDFYVQSCPSHITLAERMRKRGTPIDAGSRLEYVVTVNSVGTNSYSQVSAVASKVGDHIEDFDYYKPRSAILQLDYLYYLRSFINPIDQILSAGLNKSKFMQSVFDYRSCYAKVLNQLHAEFRPTLRVDA